MFRFESQIDHRYRVRAGAHIEGHLIAAVDHIDHVVLPANTHVTGTILGTRRTAEPSRTRVLLDGQFTPPSVPAIRFDSLVLPGGASAPIQTAVSQRDSTMVTMNAGKKPGLRAESRAILQARKRELIGSFFITQTLVIVWRNGSFRSFPGARPQSGLALNAMPS